MIGSSKKKSKKKKDIDARSIWTNSKLVGKIMVPELALMWQSVRMASSRRLFLRFAAFGPPRMKPSAPSFRPAFAACSVL